MIIQVPITWRGQEVLIDEADLETIRAHRWKTSVDKRGRRFAVQLDPPGRRMSRVILGDVSGEIVFRDGDPLNCTRANLVVVPQAVQIQARQFPTGASGYRGVSLDKRVNRWRAYLMHEGRQQWLGLHDTPEAAARAHDNRARSLYGDHACTNF
jgi:AP2 domain